MKKLLIYGVVMLVTTASLSIGCSASNTDKTTEQGAQQVSQQKDVAPIDNSWGEKFQVGVFSFDLTADGANKYQGTMTLSLPGGDTQKNKVTAKADGQKLIIDVDFECIQWPTSCEPYNVSDIVLSKESADSPVVFVSANLMGSDGDGEPVGTVNEKLEQ